MPYSHGIFYEHQSGGLCRMHACNAYFGESKLTRESFKMYQEEFNDIIHKHKSYRGMSCIDWDFYYFFKETLVTYILRKHGTHVRHFPIGVQRSLSDITSCISGNFVFAFTKSHIFGLTKSHGIWYRVDSIGGVSPTQFENLLQSKSTGFLVPVDQYKEFYLGVSDIKRIFSDRKVKDLILEIHNTRGDLGEIDEPLSAIMSVIRTRFTGYTEAQKRIFLPIAKQFITYCNFMKNFEKNLKDVDAKINVISPIISWILTLGNYKK